MGKLAQHLRLGVRGSLRVELASERLLPGDCVVGTVFLRVEKPIEAATLKVRLHGQQVLHWMTASGDVMAAHAKKVDHLTEEILLVGTDAAFDVGDSAYPFSFELPMDLQHNFTYKCKRVEDLQGVRVSVQYAVLSTLEIVGVATSNLDAKAEFTVDPLPMAVPFGRSIEAMAEKEIKFMSLFKRGLCQVDLSVDTDVLDPSSVIEATVSLALRTTQNLKYIMLVLYEDVLVDRHHDLLIGKKSGTRSVCFRRLEKESIEWLESSGNTASTTMTLQLPITPNEISELDELSPTMTSFFVSVSYRVAVEVKFTMAPRIKVSVPVAMVRKLVAPCNIEVAPVA